MKNTCNMWQIVQTLIRLLLEEQSDLGLHFLLKNLRPTIRRHSGSLIFVHDFIVIDISGLLPYCHLLGIV